jgi:tRNA 5-methylaminomethyl-2-thiouridine biosynthesis bifunctional protein
VLCGAGYLAPPAPDGRFWIGSTYDRDEDRDDVRPADDARIRGLFTDWPGLAATLGEVRSDERFAAVRVTTPDRLPMVGWLPDPADAVPTLVSLAHGSRGSVTAPFGAALLVAMACGEPPPLALPHLRRLDPCRVRGCA